MIATFTIISEQKMYHMCSFSNKSVSLQVHMASAHSSPKMYSCELCSRTFTNLSHLNIHKKKHSGVKDLVCSICNRTFGQKCHLAMHLKKAHAVSVSNTHISVFFLFQSSSTRPKQTAPFVFVEMSIHCSSHKIFLFAEFCSTGKIPVLPV